MAESAHLTSHLQDAPSFSLKLDHPLIDLVLLSRQSLGERELEMDLLRLFRAQSVQILARLNDATTQEPKLRRDLAHTLKGSARAVGANAVASAAAVFEERVGLVCESGALAELTQAAQATQATIDALLA